MPIKKLKNFLNENGIKYISIIHSKAYTAQEIAESVHLSGKSMAKTIILRIDGDLGMIILPAHIQLDVEKIGTLTTANTVFFAKEEDFKDAFPNCALGAMPPFGNLFGMDVYVSNHFDKKGDIFFNAGSHSEVIQMSYVDYIHLVQPSGYLD